MVYCVHKFVVQTIVYRDPLTKSKIFTELASLLFLYVVITVMTFLFLYVRDLHGKMGKLIVENIKLLNRMHEGILIISKKDNSVVFANKPASEFLNNSCNESKKNHSSQIKFSTPP